MSIRYIRSTSELSELCEQATVTGRIGIDTEFIRDRTYYAQLALVQLAVEDTHVLVDPLADGLSLEPLEELLSDETVIKVLHAATQDLEIFYQRTGCAPASLFDTQIAAAMCGHGLQVSYGAAVETLLGVKVNKGARYTDWLRRPLSEAQETYALADVEHLFALHDTLQSSVSELGRDQALAEELLGLCAPNRYTTSAADVARRLKGAGRLDERTQAILLKLVEWREAEAARSDVPRRWVLADDSLIAMARSAPTSHRELRDVRGAGKAASRAGDALLEAIAAGKSEALPKVEKKAPRQKPTEAQSTAADFVRSVIRTLCRDAAVAPSMVASSSDIEQLVIAHYNGDDLSEHALMQGWRGAIVGDRVRAF
ncbi:MAG: ribonuclease D, partial [Myxococcota bacterium]